MNNLPNEVLAAANRIRPYVRETPSERCEWLAAEAPGAECETHLKLENFQVTGSFKIRGALSKILALEPGTRARGVIAASSGNYGLAVAHAHRVTGVPTTVVLPEVAVQAKVEAIRRGGVEVIVHGEDCVLAEKLAREIAAERGAAYLSPYNDLLVMAGQGTLGVELDAQLERLDVVYVAVGGGGLIGGVAAYLKQRRPDLEVVGCSPERSAVMCASVRAGQLLDLPSEPTLSDGTAGGVEAGSITFEPCRQLVDRWELIEEEAIAEAMRLLLEHDRLLVEGAAGVALAACLADLRQHPERLANRSAAVVLCGRNLGTDVLAQILGKTSPSSAAQTAS